MKYRSEIDGLRSIAVIPVMLFHAGFTHFSGGFVGVDIFFVISGYLITSIILSEKEKGKFSIINFYDRRARRILPALYLVMLVSLFFAWFCLFPRDFEDFSKSLMAVSLFSSNFLFWSESGYFDTASELKPLLHTWSLAVEEQFYILFPLFLSLVWWLRKRWVLSAIVLLGIFSFLLAEWGAQNKPSATFFLLPTRAWELMLGASSAFYLFYGRNNQVFIKGDKFISEALSLLGLAFIFLSVFIFDEKTPFPSVYALLPTIGTVLIILFCSGETVVGKLLRTKILVGIGLISYSAYLWHQPLFAFAHHRSILEPGQTLLGGLVVISLILAYFSWKYVEAPFRSNQKFERKQIFFFSASGAVFFIIVGIAGDMTEGAPSRIDVRITEIQSINMSIFESQVETCWNGLVDNPSIDNACRIGDTEIVPSFGLVGDSHAGALLHQLSMQSKQKGFSGVSYAFRSCPPLMSIEPDKPTDGDMPCSSLRDSFFTGLLKSNSIPDILVVNARWALLIEKNRFDNGEGGIEGGDDWVWDLADENYSTTMTDVIVKSIREMLDSGRKVILVYPVPEMGWQVPSHLAKSYLIGGELQDKTASVSYQRFVSRNKRAIKALDSIGEYKNLVRIKPSDYLCDSYVSNRCVAHLGEKPLYFDDNHLSSAGSSLVVTKVISQIKH